MQSMAIHDRKMTPPPSQGLPELYSLKMMVVSPSQLSKAISSGLSPVKTGGSGMFRHVTVRSTAGKEPIQMGAVVSTTIKVWLPSMKLPQSSVAVQVRMRVYLDGHGPSTISSVSTTSTLSSQLSTAVQDWRLLAPHCIRRSHQLEFPLTIREHRYRKPRFLVWPLIHCLCNPLRSTFESR